MWVNFENYPQNLIDTSAYQSYRPSREKMWFEEMPCEFYGKAHYAH